MAERYREDWEPSDRYSFVMKRIGEMEQTVIRARREFYQLVDQSWELHVRNPAQSTGIFDRISRNCKETASLLRQWAQNIFPYLGITAVMLETPINQVWRDLQTVCQHVMLVSFGKED